MSKKKNNNKDLICLTPKPNQEFFFLLAVYKAKNIFFLQ